ncbi:hypothetical protein ACEPAH_4809 [Sanghuangporus vaninii]
MNEKEQLEKESWKRLVSWMETKGFDASQLCVESRIRKEAARGLFVTQTLHPSKKPFLVIPAKALLNSRTLSAMYRSIALEGFTSTSSSDRLVISGIQLLSIHLALHRPTGRSYSKDPHFGVYIDTFPRDFDSHPLTWIIKEKLSVADSHETKLLQSLPPSVRKELEEVAKRFWNDWDVAVQAKDVYFDEFQSKNEALFDVHGFLWGWLVVNSRSLYMDIFRRKLPFSNLTLCPLIDFANHTSSSSLPRAKWRDAPKSARDHRVVGGVLKAYDYCFLPPDQTMNEGDELFLKYGEHSNRTLFAEYGFVDDGASQEVDVSDLVDELVVRKRPRKLIDELLSDAAHHFMSDLKLYNSPPPNHPSWSLQCVLRLINIEFRSERRSEGDLSLGTAEMEMILQPWRDVTLGEADLVSNANESLVRHDLESICKILVSRSSEGIRRLEENEAFSSGLECDWYGWAKGCITRLWSEEAQIAQGVLSLLASDQEGF